MNNATQSMRCFAGSLIAHQAEVAEPDHAGNASACRVIAKLRPLLSTFMGRNGFHALLSRALVLAWIEVPWLRGLNITADGSFENFEEIAGQLNAPDVVEGSEVLVARLLGLLVAFIGEALTLRLVYDLWPGIPQDPNFTQGDNP